jgi:2'-5' RNA ligase
MATSANKPPLVAYNTALVLLPPREYAHRINPFRYIHDKSGQRWTAHITTIFPFVEDVYLPETANMLREVVRDIKPFKLSLDSVHKFSIRDYDTVHLTVGRKEDQRDVQQLWKAISTALGYKGRPFIPHMTLGQAPNRGNAEALHLLNQKAQRILESVKELDWIVGALPSRALSSVSLII